MPTLKKYKGVVYLWLYVPSLVGSIIFAVLFALITAAHGWKMTKTKLWYCSPFVIGGICEVFGYIFRAVAYNTTDSLVFFIIQATLLLLPPVFFAVTLYMVYSRLVRAVHAEHLSPITLRWTTRIFVIGDFITLNIQTNGAGLLANDKLADIGNAIVITGLVLQIVLFLVFVLCCFVFHRRFRTYLAISGATNEVPWRSCLNMLYGTSLAILVRNIFRVVEYIMDKDGYFQQKEWPTFLFDSVLMLIVMMAFFVWYPSELQPRTRGSMMELKSQEGDSAVMSGPVRSNSVGR